MTARSAPIEVLCLNDDPELLALTARGLERESDRLSVTTAASVADAMETVRSESVDCVVSDYHLPDRNGVDFLRAVRERDADLPFVMYTETGTEAAASEAIGADVTDYVVRDAIADQNALLARKIVSYVEKRRSERRAVRTERWLRELADVSNDVLWMFSADWEELLFLNDAFEDVFGLPVESVREDPTSFLDRVHPDDLDPVRDTMAAVAAGETRRLEYRVEPSASLTIWVESLCVPVTEDGAVTRLTGFTRDITERKVRERELAETNDRLERFATTVAHDLRNPLNVAYGNVGIATEEADSDELRTAREAIADASGLLDDLLSLARSGETIGDRSSVALSEVVEASGLDVSARPATVEVAADGRIRCDPARLKEAFGNLFRNAIEHNDAAVTITVGMLPGGDGFYVEDDGEGIPAPERDRVFENGYTNATEGTGFGLAIVERVVEAHGWEIAVTEGADGGARFEITGLASAN